jgi:hypothetical protein
MTDQISPYVEMTDFSLRRNDRSDFSLRRNDRSDFSLRRNDRFLLMSK